MKSWDFSKIEGSSIRINDWFADTMGITEGGFVYSTLFQYPEQGPKNYELILSMYPQENFRALARITVYADDVPGSTVQSAKFLAENHINILNSVSLTGISDTTIVWNIMADLNFAGEGELIKERFKELKDAGDARVDKIQHISISPAGIGRMFRTDNADSSRKTELKHGAPITFRNKCLDLAAEYGDILGNIDGQEVMITLDPSSWLVSVVFFKPKTDLVKIDLSVPDCMGSVGTALTMLAESDVNLISVFTKVSISYQCMEIETVADISKWGKSIDALGTKFKEYLSNLNGVFELKSIEKL